MDNPNLNPSCELLESRNEDPSSVAHQFDLISHSTKTTYWKEGSRIHPPDTGKKEPTRPGIWITHVTHRSGFSPPVTSTKEDIIVSWQDSHITELQVKSNGETFSVK